MTALSSWRASGARASGASARSAERARASRARCSGAGVRRGDVVMTLIGNRPSGCSAMLACFRIGAVVLPCTEQLRAKDLRLRIDVARPALILADERNRAELEAAAARRARARSPSPARSPDEAAVRTRARAGGASWRATTPA